MFIAVFTSVFFILSNSVIAQASTPQTDLGIAKVETSKWVATHAGNTQIDGLEVVASLETVTHEIEIPKELANKMNTLVPLVSLKKKSVRIALTAVENPSLRVKFPLVGRNVSVDGVTRFAYITESDSDFQFLIVADDENNLTASYVRKISPNDFEEGEIQLSALPSILQ
jgi:hypothetical protein